MGSHRYRQTEVAEKYGLHLFEEHERVHEDKDWNHLHRIHSSSHRRSRYHPLEIDDSFSAYDSLNWCRYVHHRRLHRQSRQRSPDHVEWRVVYVHFDEVVDLWQR